MSYYIVGVVAVVVVVVVVVGVVVAVVRRLAGPLCSKHLGQKADNFLIVPQTYVYLYIDKNRDADFGACFDTQILHWVV